MTAVVAPIPDDTVKDMERAFETWDRTAVAARAAAAEELRLAFVERFPLTAWPTMTLEQYALGQTVDGGTVCWWLEFHTKPVASMSGGSSAKHLIFKGSDGEWRYPKRYASVEEAWRQVRAGFVEAFRLAGGGDIDAIYDIEALYGAPALRTKALYMYFPDRFIPVCSFMHLHRFLERLGQQFDANWVLGSNVQLMDTLRTVPFLQPLSNGELGFFLYHWMDPQSAARMVKIAPGESARFWDDCLAGGYICVGWDEVGDLSRYATKDDFRRAFAEQFGAMYQHHESTLTRKANEVWTLRTLEPGDQVIANRGIGEVLAVGTVNDRGYEFRNDRAEYRHTLGVDWDTSQGRMIEPIGAWRTTTVSKISATQYRKIFGGGADTVPGTGKTLAADDLYLDVENALRSRGQVVLYGPPGTGKTYLARRSAVWFLEGASRSPSATALLGDDIVIAAREQHYSGTPQLTRVTFHPSYTYEDFVEGFRPHATGQGGLELRLADGVFKRVCAAALQAPEVPHVVLIDEINRGNIAKIFGELITLIEHDKRGLTVTLPQSGDDFSVPANVFIVATMNTADRSIQLLDTALRRRFRFIELMPDSEVLQGLDIAGLALGDFLDHLNDSLRGKVGRDRQIGHAVLFQHGAVINTPEAFADVFRHELLPLVQEYLYDNYTELAELFGPDIVDPDRERITANLDDPVTLCAVLAEHFDARA